MALLKIPIESNEFPNPEIKEGDTIFAIEFDFDDTPIDITGSTIKMQLYNEQGERTMDISTGNGITILSAKKFNIDEVERNSLKAGIHRGDIEITFPNNDRVTYCDVVYKIVKEYTKQV